MMATAGYNLPILKELLRAGADPNLQNEVILSAVYTLLSTATPIPFQEGITALIISSRSGESKLTETLLLGWNISVDIQTVCVQAGSTRKSRYILFCSVEHWLVSTVLCC